MLYIFLNFFKLQHFFSFLHSRPFQKPELKCWNRGKKYKTSREWTLKHFSTHWRTKHEWLTLKIPNFAVKRKATEKKPSSLCGAKREKMRSEKEIEKNWTTANLLNAAGLRERSERNELRVTWNCVEFLCKFHTRIR